METSIESQSDIFEFLCNKSNVFDYFNEFYLLLDETKSYFDFSNQNSVNFLQGLRYLEQNNFFNIQKCEELNSILIKIFDTLCDKYLQSVIDGESVDSVAYGFDLIAFLIKILIDRTDQKIDLLTLQNFLINYFQTFSVNQEKCDACENEKELLHQAVQFLAKILKCLNHKSFLNYVTNEYLIKILQSMPLSDNVSVNVFVNQILPHLFTICKIEHKTLIIDYLWKKIVSSFEVTSNSNVEPYFYSLLCCLTEFAFKEHFESSSLNLHNDIIWKIIQIGLTSYSSYYRKQALYSFKMLLFYAKSENIPINQSGNISLFYIHSNKDLLIWNDLVTLFETLEEKQIHIIKPVLPKFARILQHVCKRSSTDKDLYILHPSWVTCFIRRMLLHESKFISKQGLSMAMELNLKDYFMNLLNPELFIHDLLEAFNDQNMYSRMNETDNLSLFLSSAKISVFLMNFVSAFDTQEQKVDFLRYILKHIASQSWCGVALMHLTFALTNLNSLPSWKSSDIMQIRKIIQHSVKALEPIFRTAIEHWFLKSCLLLMDWNSVCLMDLLELLSVFKSLQRHTVIWNTAADKLKDIFLSESYNNLSIHAAKAFVTNFIGKMSSSEKESLGRSELQKIAKLFMILADSSIILPEQKENSIYWPQLLRPLTSLLKDAPNRPYLSTEKFYNVLQFYIFLITESHGSNKSIADDHCTIIIECFNFSSEFLEFIYQKSIMDLKTADDIIQFQILCHALTVLSSLDGQYELFLKLLPHFLIKCSSVPQHFLSRKVIIIFFYSILNSYSAATEYSNVVSLSFNLLSKITSEHIIDDLSKSVCMSGIEKEIMLELSSEFISEFWKITSNVVTYLPPSDLKNVAAALFQQAQNTFNGGPISAVPYAIDCIRLLIPVLGSESTQMVENLLFSAWKACSELHGSETYRHALSCFTLAVFQPYMLQDKYFHVLYEYLDYFQKLSENTVGIFYLVITQFCKVFSIQSLFKINFNFVPILIHALTYGPIHHKGQKILEDTVAYLSEHDKSFSLDINYNKPSVFVRVAVIVHLMESLRIQCYENEKIACMLINGLLELDDFSIRAKSSKFANSYSHRVRNRIWQAILLLHPYLVSSNEYAIFLKKILNILDFDNQQPSIRFLQEWIIFKVLHVHKIFITDFVAILETSFDKRPGFLISILSVLVHLIACGLIESEDNASKCFPSLINYCMAQNFSVRLYGRLAVTKLFAYCENQNYSATIEKYDFLHKLILQQSESSLPEKGNIYKNLIKLSNDFYFNTFHPIHHYTLETIFFELPRLSNVSSEEWIKPSYFERYFGSSNFSIPCYNSDDSLKYSSVTSWSDKAVEESAMESESFDFNFQKKICPSKPGSDIFGTNGDSLTDSKPKNDLIVIASLIDRIPNLGGLCRTCEVFGVNEFIISSLKYTEDKQFQNLAVSADKWITIKEVKPYNLKEYLLSLKDEGYTLIGAEQTDDSHKLSNYIFPKKSAVLLGHEKEGMPVNLIQLLDACVEIPQQGIIRSLNVHVSGAVFIWEYARQQINQNL